MGEIANYFAKEKYIKIRLSLLALGATALLAVVVFAGSRGRISARMFEWVVAILVLCIASVVVLILQGARAKFPKSAGADDAPLDPITERKLRRRIRLLQAAAVFYALALIYGLLHAHKGSLLPVLSGAVMNLLLEAVLIKTIRRLKSKLKQATAVSPGGNSQ